MCPIEMSFRATRFNGRTNEPPRDTKISVLLQRSADGHTVDRGPSGIAQEGLVGDSSLGKLFLLVAVDGCL